MLTIIFRIFYGTIEETIGEERKEQGQERTTSQDSKLGLPEVQLRYMLECCPQAYGSENVEVSRRICQVKKMFLFLKRNLEILLSLFSIMFCSV